MTQKSRIVVVSNRLPVHRVGRGPGQRWATSPGGLVSALTPILRSTPSTWIGWPGVAGAAPAPFDHEGIRNVPVGCTRDEVNGFYEGFSNRTLWPLYHDCIRTPEFHRHWWRPYVEVNQRFADRAIAELDPDGVVWVHDYHLQLVPAMIRAKLPRARIGFFLHTPFPPPELFARLPWRRQVMEGVLGADVAGFQTQTASRNFSRFVRTFRGGPAAGGTIQYQGRTVQADSFPISIDVQRFEGLAAADSVHRRSEQLRARLQPGRRILLGVDRLDYTKGIDVRLRAFRDLLRSGRIAPEECVLVQVAVPSRERVDEYRRLRGEVERLVGEINGEFGDLGQVPIHYLHRSLSQEELVALYRIADVMLVTPFRDGMNLVAKEFVASRPDHRGVLVLSEFTGAASEMQSALLVNPHDIDGLADTLHTALRMSESEQAQRMRSLRRAVRRNDVYDWANGFLGVLAPEGTAGATRLVRSAARS